MDDVVCAQAFHWFATPAAAAEMRRALVPDGVLGLIRNGRDEDVPWVAALSEKITDRREGDTPRYRSGAWSQAFPAPGLAFVDEQHVRNSHIGVAEDVVLKRTVSVSFTAGLPEHRRLDVERDVRSLIAQTHELADGKQFERRAAKCDADMGDGDFFKKGRALATRTKPQPSFNNKHKSMSLMPTANNFVSTSND